MKTEMDIICTESVMDEILSKINFNKIYTESEKEMISCIREYIPYEKLMEFDNVINLSSIKYAEQYKDIYKKGFKKGIRFILEVIKQD